MTRLPHLLLASGALSCCFAFRTVPSVTRTFQLHATSISSTSWKPCVQPRFDEFASCTVGPWVTRASPTEKHEVEEVMRSCGGAVQGVRELSPSLDANEEKIYLNRADGGFVYVDDGSYSFGPEKLDLTDETMVMASLAFTGSQRGWLTAKLSSEDGMLPQSTVLEMFRPISSVTEKVAVVENLEQDASVPSINWKRIQRVRMPNSSQPWVLARAKWEQQTLPDEASNDDDQSGTGPLMGWSFVETIGSKENVFGDIVGSESSFCVHMTAICQESAVARSTTRCYDSTGLLKGVAFLEGRVRGELD
mmetsp:Transcript_16440/g.25462  ORF Transcript_16440/g.25462 Transcript_16440/m.25462 type:complete len:306 (+) Transcript_16440:79-996(+)